MYLQKTYIIDFEHLKIPKNIKTEIAFDCAVVDYMGYFTSSNKKKKKRKSIRQKLGTSAYT